MPILFIVSANQTQSSSISSIIRSNLDSASIYSVCLRLHTHMDFSIDLLHESFSMISRVSSPNLCVDSNCEAQPLEVIIRFIEEAGLWKEPIYKSNPCFSPKRRYSTHFSCLPGLFRR